MISWYIVFIATILMLFVLSISSARNILYIVLATTLVSIFSTLLYIEIGAVDVAFTEAAVGAGVSTVLLLIITFLTKTIKLNIPFTAYEYNKYMKRKRIFTVLLLIVIFFIFIDVISSIPTMGDIKNPINNYLYNTYISESYNTFEVSNVVTMILGSFRGFDTLGETIVILSASLGVILILRSIDKSSSIFNKTYEIRNFNEEVKHLIHEKFIFNSTASREEKHHLHLKSPRTRPFINNQQDSISTTTILAIFPLVMLFAFYVQYHGDYGPGGGFQAGVIFASCYIMIALVFGYFNADYLFSEKVLLTLLPLGGFIYAFTGFATMFLGGAFLDYFAFGKNFTSAYHYGLFIIELGVGITVFASMSIIVGKFCLEIRNTI